MRLELSDVALVCCDTRDANRSLASIHRSLKLAKFGDCILVTSEPAMQEVSKDLEISREIRTILIDPFQGISDYSRYILTDVLTLSESPFFLIAQWDSWILSASSWSDQFLNYDYVGAVWPHHPTQRVGNGGFSLRSRHLMQVSATLAAEAGKGSWEVEDDFLCRHMRPTLESSYGCKFAPESVANQFSAERTGWDGQPFGFHGLLNFGRVFDSQSLFNELEQLQSHYFGDRHSVDLAQYLLTKGRIHEARYVIGRRIDFAGLTTKNLKLLLAWFFRALMAPKTFFRHGCKSNN